jgi:hypothetical protein
MQDGRNTQANRQHLSVVTEKSWLPRFWSPNEFLVTAVTEKSRPVTERIQILNFEFKFGHAVLIWILAGWGLEPGTSHSKTAQRTQRNHSAMP